MSLAEWFKKRAREDPEWAAQMRERYEELTRNNFDADFNDTDDAGRIMVLVPEDKTMPELGHDVHMYDADDNYCRGTVRDVGGRLLSVEAYWDTWWIGHPVPREECPDRDKHRVPEGPNEDWGMCRLCHAHTFEMRPEGETYGDHLPDCSLPRRHESYRVGGGAGHPRAPKIRGYFGPAFDEDIDLVACTADGVTTIMGYWTEGGAGWLR